MAINKWMSSLRRFIQWACCGVVKGDGPEGLFPVPVAVPADIVPDAPADPDEDEDVADRGKE